MDFSKCNSSEMDQVVNGSAAAWKGEPWNEHQTELWKAGFMLWTMHNSSSAKPAFAK